jgi:hypothetical protein
VSRASVFAPNLKSNRYRIDYLTVGVLSAKFTLARCYDNPNRKKPLWSHSPRSQGKESELLHLRDFMTMQTGRSRYEAIRFTGKEKESELLTSRACFGRSISANKSRCQTNGLQQGCPTDKLRSGQKHTTRSQNGRDALGSRKRPFFLTLDTLPLTLSHARSSHYTGRSFLVCRDLSFS